MLLRLIAGRAGSGKSTHCIREIRARLRESPANGPRLILLVPEQAALQSERALLADAPLRVLGRCDVLGFRRLTRRILDGVIAPLPVVVSATGRQMLLRRLISRHRRSLSVFDAVAEKPGFIAGLSETISELIQHRVQPEQLRAACPADADADDTAVRALRETARLLDLYLESLGDQRVDPEDVLALAARHVATTDWLRGAEIWLDGFAGFTPQQSTLLAAVAETAAAMNVALLMDPQARCVADPHAQLDPWSLFAHTEETWRDLAGALVAAGATVSEPLRLGDDTRPRFAQEPLLQRVERDFFHAPAAPAQAATARNVRLFRAPTPRDECRLIAAEIRRRCVLDPSPWRYRDIAIICRSLEPYHDLLSAALAELDIPFFIDRRRPTAHHPLIELLRAALSLQEPFRFADGMAALLKCGLSPLSDDETDLIENYLLAAGIREPKAWAAAWKPRSPSMDDLEELRLVLAVRDRLLTSLEGTWPANASPPPNRNGREWAAWLHSLLERWEVSDRLERWSAAAIARGDLDESQVHVQIWNDVVALLDELAEVLSDEPLTPGACADVLDAALGDFSLGLVPPTLDQVLVGAIDRSRHPSVRGVFLPGWAEGMFPARPSEGPLFGDRERLLLERAGLRVGARRESTIRDERLLAYVAVTRASDLLWVSSPITDSQGKPLAPSPYLSHLAAAAGVEVESQPATSHRSTAVTPSQWTIALASQVRETSNSAPASTFVEPPSWAAAYEVARTTPALAAGLQQALAAAKPGIQQPLSPDEQQLVATAPYVSTVSRLETFAACPFKHFAEYTLALRPRARHELGAAELGSLAHRMLEHFFVELSSGHKSLADLTPADVAARLEAIRRDVLPRVIAHSPVESGLLERAAMQVEREVRPPLAAGYAQPPTLQTLGAEIAFGGANADWPALRLTTPRGRTVELHGKIDRVDVVSHADTHLGVVCDYKRSRSVRLRLDEAWHGLSLQLLTYLIVLQQHGENLRTGGIRPAAALLQPLLGSYKSVAHPADIAPGSGEPFRTFLPRGVIDFDAIGALDPAIADGGTSRHFSVQVKKEGGIAREETSDALPSQSFSALLVMTRLRLGELLDAWIDGDCRVLPSYFDGGLPCGRCDHRPVCRFQPGVTPVAPRLRMKRGEMFPPAEAAAP